jgi:hypothetical protein
VVVGTCWEESAQFSFLGGMVCVCGLMIYQIL